MKIIIHQSLCGEEAKAWSLLKSTMPDKNLARSIAFKTDLQEQTGGVIWGPATRGFKVGIYYVVMRTFEDTSLEVRRGRKFSHVLILEKKDIENLYNLNDVIGLLPAYMDKEAVLEPITIDLQGPETPIIFFSKFQQRFNKLIHGYINLKEYENVLLWLGQDDFELAVTELWKRLTVEERFDFNFGITFNNETSYSDHINLMSIPDGIQSKFLKSGSFTIGKEDRFKPVNLVEQILLNDDKANKRLDAFKETFQITSISRMDITFISKGIDTFEDLKKTIDIKKINTLSHIIAKYAPSEKQGEHYKSDLLHRIIHLFNDASFFEIMVLRTFKLESFKSSQTLLSIALIAWLKENIFKSIRKRGIYKGFFEQYVLANQNWWDNLIHKQLEIFLNTLNKVKAEVIYSWLSDDITIFAIIKKYIDRSSAAEASLTEKLPKNATTQLINILKKFSMEQRWFKLYASLLVKQLTFENALKELLLVDQEIDSFDALKIILKNRKPKEIVVFAANSGDKRMHIIAGKHCAQVPGLLNFIDVLNINWQAIWCNAIKNGNIIDKGIKGVREKVFQLLDSLIEGNAINDDLLYAIADSEYGNLLTYENSAELWPKLPLASRNLFLKKTTSILLEELSENSSREIPDDIYLRDYIADFGINDFVYYNRSKIKNVIPIFETFDIKDDYIREYLNNYSGEIGLIDAKRLGEIINENRFKNSAYTIYKKATKDNNWRFALTECLDLITTWDRISIAAWGILSSTKLTEDQWWQSTEELVVELYPDGPSLQTLWRKSGGKDSDLIMNTTPAIVWQDAFYKLRRNGFGDITIDDLLKEIDKRYAKNEKFKIIYSLRKEFL